MNSIGLKNFIPTLTEEKDFILVEKFTLDSSLEFHKKFRSLNENPQIGVIPIVVTSYGGSIYSLFGMLDTISMAKKPVATIAIGAAMSCGSILLSAGTRGYRFAGETTGIMIHEFSATEFGKITDLAASVKDIGLLNNKTFRLLAKNCGQKDQDFFLKQMRKRTNTDWNLTARQSKKIGLIDHIGIPNFIK